MRKQFLYSRCMVASPAAWRWLAWNTTIAGTTKEFRTKRQAIAYCVQMGAPRDSKLIDLNKLAGLTKARKRVAKAMPETIVPKEQKGNKRRNARKDADIA